MSVLNKIENLMALATSSNENEARTAAYMAVKLIKENNLVVVLPSQAGETESFDAKRVRDIAKKDVRSLMAFLKKKRKVDEYPVYSVKMLIALAQANHKIKGPLEKGLYKQTVANALEGLFVKGMLCKAPRKGYYVPRDLTNL